MNFHSLLGERAAAGRPVRVGLIGGGKFGSMFLSQARRVAGLHVLGIADLAPERARVNLARIGWEEERYAATSFAAALQDGGTHITDDAERLVAADGLDVIIDATGDPAAGIRHVTLACAHKRHIVMVNVEADALAGPLLARRAREAGIVYSLAYGDQPALIAEQVDWARTCGFEIVAAGKGTKYLPEYHASTDETVWDFYGISAERAALGGMNAKMFNSFLDGTKSGIEMAAVANACGLDCPADGLSFPAVGTQELAAVLKPRGDGGVLERRGMVEVISCLNRDGTPVERDLRWGVYVTFAARDDYAAQCFAEYGLITDESGIYTAMYRPWHLIGLELAVSVASAAVRGEPTGTPQTWNGDVVAVAKRALAAGETLDGEGGSTVWGRLMPAADSLALGGLPIGLSHDVRLKNPIAVGQPVRWQDVAIDETSAAVRVRREMEAAFAPEARAAE
ncbi:MAG: flagellar biosynthesis protein FlgA [Rhodospirillales bacterium]|nr:MAG: flagellar biosynthesis protein FlgA [Rhodospirillales bacterium]